MLSWANHHNQIWHPWSFIHSNPPEKPIHISVYQCNISPHLRISWSRYICASSWSESRRCWVGLITMIRYDAPDHLSAQTLQKNRFIYQYNISYITTPADIVVSIYMCLIVIRYDALDRLSAQTLQKERIHITSTILLISPYLQTPWSRYFIPRHCTTYMCFIGYVLILNVSQHL